MVNDVSTFRVDHMPYGGVKGSGLGREGLRYAIEEMTEHAPDDVQPAAAHLAVYLGLVFWRSRKVARFSLMVGQSHRRRR